MMLVFFFVSKCTKRGKGTYVEEKGDASGSMGGDRWKVGRTISLCLYKLFFLPLVERASELPNEKKRTSLRQSCGLAMESVFVALTFGVSFGCCYRHLNKERFIEVR